MKRGRKNHDCVDHSEKQSDTEMVYNHCKCHHSFLHCIKILHVVLRYITPSEILTLSRNKLFTSVTCGLSEAWTCRWHDPKHDYSVKYSKKENVRHSSGLNKHYMITNFCVDFQGHTCQLFKIPMGDFQRCQLPRFRRSFSAF
jgi:hypothetical protein